VVHVEVGMELVVFNDVCDSLKKKIQVSILREK
jgi:hypothetical protein